MLANQKVWGSILSKGSTFFSFPVRIYMSFHTEIPRENTSSKTREVHEKKS